MRQYKGFAARGGSALRQDGVSCREKMEGDFAGDDFQVACMEGAT